MIKNDLPLVSVLIAAYNEEKNIQNCINSIISQSYNKLEVIVIDDGSSDKTLEILNSFNDNRLRIYTQKNRGRVFSRNRALSLAKGKYVILQDADDWSSKKRIELQVNQAEKIIGIPVVGCGYELIKGNRKIKKYLPETNKQIRNKMSRRFLSQAFLPSSILILRKKLIELDGWRAKFRVAAEDGDLLDRMFEDNSIDFYNIKKVLYHYKLHEGSVTNKLEITIPYQIFKRFCKRKRRLGQKEPETFEEFYETVNSNFFTSLTYHLEYRLFYVLFKLLY